jgi:hypothetical protein
LSSLQQACYQTCTKPVHNKQFLLCHNKFQQGNKPVVGKQIENVSKEKNRTRWTLPSSLSHSIIAIAHWALVILNAKAAVFEAVLFFKNSPDFQFTDVCCRYISLILLDIKASGTCHHSSLQTKYYKHINHVIMFSYFLILSQTKFQQLP